MVCVSILNLPELVFKKSVILMVKTNFEVDR